MGLLRPDPGTLSAIRVSSHLIYFTITARYLIKGLLVRNFGVSDFPLTKAKALWELGVLFL